MATACQTKNLVGVIRGNSFKITMSSDPDNLIGMVQQFALSYTRPLERVYDLVSNDFYYVEGHTEGQVNFSKIVGPAGSLTLACDCTPRTIILSAGSGLCYSSGTSQRTGSQSGGTSGGGAAPSGYGSPVLNSAFNSLNAAVSGSATSGGTAGSGSNNTANASKELTWKLLNAYPTQLQGSGNVTNYIIQFSISYMFSDLTQ